MVEGVPAPPDAHAGCHRQKDCAPDGENPNWDLLPGRRSPRVWPKRNLLNRARRKPDRPSKLNRGHRPRPSSSLGSKFVDQSQTSLRPGAPVTEIGAYEAKTQLPALLRRVEAGERITITRHGHPIAQLVAAQPPDSPIE